MTAPPATPLPKPQIHTPTNLPFTPLSAHHPSSLQHNDVPLSLSLIVPQNYPAKDQVSHQMINTEASATPPYPPSPQSLFLKVFATSPKLPPSFPVRLKKLCHCLGSLASGWGLRNRFLELDLDGSLDTGWSPMRTCYRGGELRFWEGGIPCFDLGLGWGVPQIEVWCGVQLEGI